MTTAQQKSQKKAKEPQEYIRYVIPIIENSCIQSSSDCQGEHQYTRCNSFQHLTITTKLDSHIIPSHIQGLVILYNHIEVSIKYNFTIQKRHSSAFKVQDWYICS